MKNDDISIRVNVSDSGEDKLVIFDLKVNVANGNVGTNMSLCLGLRYYPINFEVWADGGKKDDFHGCIISQLYNSKSSVVELAHESG